jgi:hypothetical protein
MRSHQDFKGSPTASTPNSDYTISEAGVPTIPIEVEHIDGYLSDPGVDVSYFDEKGHQKKRKSDMLAMLSQNVKYRRIERSIHLK